MRQRNAKFASDVRAGKQATHPSRQEKLKQRSPVSLWALGMVVFVVIGGGMFRLACRSTLFLICFVQYCSSWPGSYFCNLVDGFHPLVHNAGKRIVQDSSTKNTLYNTAAAIFIGNGCTLIEPQQSQKQPMEEEAFDISCSE